MDCVLALAASGEPCSAASAAVEQSSVCPTKNQGKRDQGHCELDDSLNALLGAAREATVNAAKWSGASVISLFADVKPVGVSLVVQDRGQGFDLVAVPADRKGLAESIRGQMTRRGGTATVTTASGEGTKVTLKMPRTTTQPRTAPASRI